MIFEYFEGAKIGLTATPKDFLKGIDTKKLADEDPRKLEKRILLSTYETFGCKSGEPTFRFDLKQAVSHKPPYLVNPVIYDKRSDKTDQMLSEQGWTDAFIDEQTGQQVEETFKIRQLEKKVFSEGLNFLIVDELIKTAKTDPITGEVGKTIVYCISQRHASKITRLLNEIADKKYPGKYSGHNGVFARQITSNIVGSQELTKKYRNNQLGNTRIAVTVNMMTTGYDCTDLLNVVFMKPVFSMSDFVQIKGRGTRRHTFTNELTGAKTEKDNYFLIDFFGVCEYFEEKYDYKEPLKVPQVKAQGSKPIPEPTPEPPEPPIAVAHGNFIYVGSDFLVRDNQIQIGEDCMKVDREAYRNHFEAQVKDLVSTDEEFKKALKNDDIDTSERIATEQILEKPKYYFSLESLRKSYQSTNGLVDFLKKAAGFIEKLPNKYDRMNKGFTEFKVVYADTQYEKLNYYENIYQCYLTSPDYRNAINQGRYSVLDDQTLGGNVPIGRVNKSEIETVVNYIKETNIAYVN